MHNWGTFSFLIKHCLRNSNDRFLGVDGEEISDCCMENSPKVITAREQNALPRIKFRRKHGRPVYTVAEYNCDTSLESRRTTHDAAASTSRQQAQQSHS